MSKLRKLISCSMNLQKLKIVCFLAAFPLLLSGCNFVNSVSETSTTPPLNVDQSMTTGEPCKGPCWYGVVVGQSNIEELQAILPTLEFVDEGSIKVEGEWDRGGSAMKSIYWDCQNPLIKNCGNADFEVETGFIVNLYLNLGYEATLSDLIALYKNPDEVFVFTPLSTGKPKCELDFRWNQSGISAFNTVILEWDNSVCGSHLKDQVTPQMVITGVVYYSTEHQTYGCEAGFCIPWEDVPYK